jgi:hypothetical protein
MWLNAGICAPNAHRTDTPTSSWPLLPTGQGENDDVSGGRISA